MFARTKEGDKGQQFKRAWAHVPRAACTAAAHAPTHRLGVVCD